MYDTKQHGAGSICPAGWHIPTDSEWQAMFAHPDHNRIDPSYGGCITCSNTQAGLGATAYMWTANEVESGLEGTAFAAVIAWPTKNLPSELDTFNKGNRLAAMCVRSS